MPSKYPDQSMPWPIIWEGVQLIAESEGCRLKAYQCPAGVWTIGWGETDSVYPACVWSQRDADLSLCKRLGAFATDVRIRCEVQPDEHELAAMVSLAWNIGLTAFANSTVLKRHNAGDKNGAAGAFRLWNKARIRGQLQVVDGLVTRRAKEAALYLTPDAHAAEEPMPQAVAPESRLAASPIMRSGLATAGSGALVLAAQVSDPVASAVTQVTAAAATVGIAPAVLLGAGLVVAGGAAVWWRAKQRSEGWA